METAVAAETGATDTKSVPEVAKLVVKKGCRGGKTRAAGTDTTGSPLSRTVFTGKEASLILFDEGEELDEEGRGGGGGGIASTARFLDPEEPEDPTPLLEGVPFPEGVLSPDSLLVLPMTTREIDKQKVTQVYTAQNKIR